jgi:hypothetical protein
MPEELNEKLRKELRDILDPPAKRRRRQVEGLAQIFLGDNRHLDRSQYEEMAIDVAKALDSMPACFWVKLFEIAEEITNPILHSQTCQSWDGDAEKCVLGHPEIECGHSCPDYVGVKNDYSTYLECNGDCKEHPTKPADDEGGPHA